ncbi:endonuclease [Winogradskyella marincola]|uniref:Endonuclease n=1 Tax=Winogradskyella marincola TaxID=3037795 RepID=A0ABT6G3L1_9FLAO|nr:endonuclease [Winogradskyella sp. YYF002]MDG4716635.1 endonuclease [Winogradskyella sp. YYF002]
MKQFYTLIATLIFSTVAFAQIPAGYYDSATGTGYTLKTQLHNIIDNHNDQGYNAMDGFISSYDLDNYYETGSNTILDPYSENPTGSDPYTFSPVSDECGNYNSEGDCYNKEHIIPQSVFNQSLPMRSDAHHLLPTDGRVNGFRSNYPFGVVDDSQLVNQSGISNPTQNGSKLGGNLNSGYSAGYTNTVFEPIDEFKGDIARIYFYFVTRYEDQVGSWGSYAMFDGSSDKVLDDPFLSILLTWHQNDPVSQKEIDRNNNIYYNHQSNRNPFVDHPEWVNAIWVSTPDTEAPTAPTNLVVTNEASTSINISWTASTDNVSVESYDVYVDGVFNTNVTATAANIINLTPETTYSFYVIAIDTSGNESSQSNAVNGTTTEVGTPGSDCVVEDFENIPANSSQYTSRTWTGTNGTWNATEARTDQSINNRAILIDYRGSSDSGVLTSPTATDGIGNLTVTTQRIFSGTDGNLNVVVNGNIVGTIPYSDTQQTTTISNINIEGNVTVEISDNDSGDARVGIDDLSWTCYSSLSINENDLDRLTIYPNPVGSYLNVNLKNPQATTIEIFDVLGKRVYKNQLSSTKRLNLESLKTGVYIIKFTQNNKTISKKLIKS